MRLHACVNLRVYIFGQHIYTACRTGDIYLFNMDVSLKCAFEEPSNIYVAILTKPSLISYFLKCKPTRSRERPLLHPTLSLLQWWQESPMVCSELNETAYILAQTTTNLSLNITTRFRELSVGTEG